MLCCELVRQSANSGVVVQFFSSSAMHVITYTLPTFGSVECHLADTEYLHDIIVNLKYVLSHTCTVYANRARSNENYLLGAEALLLPAVNFVICGSILLTCTLEPPMLNSTSVVDDTHVIESAFICRIQARRATAEELLSGGKLMHP
ncbi:Hypothetical protein DHA2_150165 [Giardia duodenalis]|uniref:Uncharacterized protein n=1 Tax=Giardia intestinalis TaxID=5741 RepID=V6TJC0_GIAIN|nr:Hypothetical protein DHA2_150165 [Giardia intestinalis]